MLHFFSLAFGTVLQSVQSLGLATDSQLKLEEERWRSLPGSLRNHFTVYQVTLG